MSIESFDNRAGDLRFALSQAVEKWSGSEVVDMLNMGARISRDRLDPPVGLLLPLHGDPVFEGAASCGYDL